MFQIDSEIVQSVYNKLPNYKIVYDDSCSENRCAIYFSSNNIYYPNTEEIFRKRIVEKDFFEWYHTRVKARKHIFVRDVFKQWYIDGINTEIDSPEKLLTWLKQEAGGQDVITIGSSAGGYAAILYGSLLGASKVFAFNAQFSLWHLVNSSSYKNNPLLNKYKATGRSRLYLLKEYLNNTTNYFYFCSLKNKEDIEQYRILFSSHFQLSNLYCLKFYTSHHGIPFLKVALPRVLNLEDNELKMFVAKINNPFLFSIRMVGIFRTICGLVKQVYCSYQKRK